jgi:hypothetical protein
VVGVLEEGVTPAGVAAGAGAGVPSFAAGAGATAGAGELLPELPELELAVGGGAAFWAAAAAKVC